MPIFNAQGLPVKLLLQPDKNFSDLAAQLTLGQRLRGRITEVLADGKAIVNFRGIPVTAELKGVTVQRGEVISVAVQELKDTPTFRLLSEEAPPLSPAEAGRGSTDDATVASVQIPLVQGTALRGGTIQVSWRRGKGRQKRDRRHPANIHLSLDTRELGAIRVQIHVLEPALKLMFRVLNAEVQAFINQELPELLQRLRGYKFHVVQCSLDLQLEETPVSPPSSVDVKA